ncbi:hypothetical protein DFH06DRAFT_1485682 [Mycena polygramma]|nr:hypothetical protein DFH06DRAFT_1485682 [Mycena polygramma]
MLLAILRHTSHTHKKAEPSSPVMSDEKNLEPSELYGHVLSRKSTGYERDTFIFVAMPRMAQLFLGINQKICPITKALLNRWVELMSGPYGLGSDGILEKYFLRPVDIISAGILSYGFRPNGPPIEPDSTEPLPPGNYGLFFNRECTSSGTPRLSMAVHRVFSFAFRFSDSSNDPRRPVMDSISPALRDSVLARDKSRCRLTGLESAVVLRWIIPPAVAWQTEDFAVYSDRDTAAAPFFVAENVLMIHQSLTSDFLDNRFTVDVDDDYRILILHPECDAQHILPTHLPETQLNTAAAPFLRRHCRYSLDHALREGDISEDYGPRTITAAMSGLGVDFDGNDDPDAAERKMAPLSDERWQTTLGKAILRHVSEQETLLSLERKRLEDGSTWRAGGY